MVRLLTKKEMEACFFCHKRKGQIQTFKVFSCPSCMDKVDVAIMRVGNDDCIPNRDAELKLIDKIMRWHRRETDGDGFHDCVEVYNKSVEIISDVYTFTDKGEGVIPKSQAKLEAAAEKCFFCEYLRRLKAELRGD